MYRSTEICPLNEWVRIYCTWNSPGPWRDRLVWVMAPPVRWKGLAAINKRTVVATRLSPQLTSITLYTSDGDQKRSTVTKWRLPSPTFTDYDARRYDYRILTIDPVSFGERERERERAGIIISATSVLSQKKKTFDILLSKLTANLRSSLSSWTLRINGNCEETYNAITWHIIM